MREFAVVSLALVGLGIFAVPSSVAERGVGVTVGEIAVESTLSPGVGYSLPSIGVFNAGDLDTDYNVSIAYVADQRQRRPSSDWFEFSPVSFSLSPGETVDVVGRIVVPSDAEPGDYFALVKAQTTSSTSGGTNVGVAAATKVSFTVESSGWFDSRVREINRWLYESEPWIYLIPAALVLGYVAMKARRLPFRLRIERR